MSLPPDNPRDGFGDGPASTVTNGIQIVPVPTGLRTTIPSAPEPSLPPSGRPLEPENFAFTPTPAVGESSAVSTPESTGALEINVASPAQATQNATESSTPSNNQFITLSTAIALQVLGELGNPLTPWDETGPNPNSFRARSCWSRSDILQETKEQEEMAAPKQYQRRETGEL